MSQTQEHRVVTIIVILILRFCAVDTNLLFYCTKYKGKTLQRWRLVFVISSSLSLSPLSSMSLSMSLPTPINLSLYLLLYIKYPCKIAIVKYVSNVTSLRPIPPIQPLHWPIAHVKKSADTCIKTEKREREGERVQESTRISLGLGPVWSVHNTCCLREQQWRGWNFLTFFTWKFHIHFFESGLICLVCTRSWRKS